MFRHLRSRRRKREGQRAVEEGLRMLGGSFSAPEHLKRSGLERLVGEFERERRRKR
jgi:hypothetical protein